jgi:hypothetical protein
VVLLSGIPSERLSIAALSILFVEEIVKCLQVWLAVKMLYITPRNH